MASVSLLLLVMVVSSFCVLQLVVTEALPVGLERRPGLPPPPRPAPRLSPVMCCRRLVLPASCVLQAKAFWRDDNAPSGCFERDPSVKHASVCVARSRVSGNVRMNRYSKRAACLMQTEFLPSNARGACHAVVTPPPRQAPRGTGCSMAPTPALQFLFHSRNCHKDCIAGCHRSEQR